MSIPPGDSAAGDPLEPVLRDVEATLKQRLRDACEAEAGGVTNETTSEIRRLEDSLLAAAVAAEQTITLRRHIDRRKSARRRADSVDAPARDQPPAEAGQGSAPNETADPIFRVREFRDAGGQLWRAWPVTPGHARQGRTAERYLGEFHKGWICFESLDSPARRRLPQQPPDWIELSESRLVQLLDQAISAPERKARAESTNKPARPPLQ
jgi:hypothetical protein